MFRGVATALGYKTIDDKLLIYGIPLVAGTIGVFSTSVAIIITGSQFGALMFPVVALVAHRVCVRAGLITAVICMIGYNFACVPPAYEFSVPNLRELMFYACLLATALVVAPAAPKDDPNRRIYDKSPDLPFTSTRRKAGDGDTTHKHRVFWDVRPTGNWGYDCQTGEEYARLYVERLLAKEPRPVLAWIIGDMVAGGRFGATEIGFVQGLAKAHVPKCLRDKPSAPKYDAHDARS